jgi:hypothetical protein
MECQPALKGKEPMTGKWGSCLCLIGIFALFAGCKTPPPVLKPEKTPEVLTEPANEARYDTSEYPKQAFNSNSNDPTKVTSLDKALSNKQNGMPGAGGFGGMNGNH